MCRAASRIKTARVCLQMLKQLPYPSVIIGEPIFNVADITILFVTSVKNARNGYFSPNNIRFSEEGWTGGGAFDHRIQP